MCMLIQSWSISTIHMEAVAMMNLNSKLICVAFSKFGIHAGARRVAHVVASARNAMVRGKTPAAKKWDQRSKAFYWEALW